MRECLQTALFCSCKVSCTLQQRQPYFRIHKRGRHLCSNKINSAARKLSPLFCNYLRKTWVSGATGASQLQICYEFCTFKNVRQFHRHKAGFIPWKLPVSKVKLSLQMYVCSYKSVSFEELCKHTSSCRCNCIFAVTSLCRLKSSANTHFEATNTHFEATQFCSSCNSRIAAATTVDASPALHLKTSSCDRVAHVVVTQTTKLRMVCYL